MEKKPQTGWEICTEYLNNLDVSAYLQAGNQVDMKV